jgi:hypothetical protein
VFASGGHRLHSGCQSQESAAEGAGLNAQGTGNIKIIIPARNSADSRV